MKELWKEITGFEGLYKVSNLGRVKSCSRIVSQLDRWGNQTKRRIKGKILSLQNHPFGYPMVTLVSRKTNYKVRKIVGHLVLEAFIGPRPPNYVMRHYPDRNPSNCKLSNLSWSSIRRNLKDREKHGTMPKIDVRGENNPFFGRRHTAESKSKMSAAKLKAGMA